MSEPRMITLRYEVASRGDWVLSEEQMPESQPHDHTTELIRALLAHWIARTGRDAQVARNLAVRWDREQPQMGIDPDVCLIVPRTPEGDEIESLLTWKPRHHAPPVGFEVVSSNSHKDYVTAPERYAASGIGELVIFDAALRGPRSYGGPHRLQVWRRSPSGEFERVAAGEGPVHVRALEAWAFAVDEGRRLRFADDREGTRWWATAEEAALADKAAALADKAAALARVAELEAKLARE